jgi:nucleotide-binding universal stress UspA family protein
MAKPAEFRVVVATDGSSQARAAVAAAVAFPWPAGTTVRGIVARSAALGAMEWPAPVWSALDEGFERVASEARRVLRRRWPAAEVAVVDKPAVSAIAEASASADALVLGSRGLGAVGRALLGSVSRGVLRRATCPTLVVKGRLRRVASLVVGVDGSTNARRAVAFVAGLAAPRGARVTLVTAVERVRPQSLGLMPAGVRATLAREMSRLNAQREAAARRELESAAGRLEAAGWTVAMSVRTGVPLEELLAAAGAARADAVVVGARGTGGVARLLLGSVAEGALNRCPVSVLLVR